MTSNELKAAAVKYGVRLCEIAAHFKRSEFWLYRELRRVPMDPAFVQAFLDAVNHLAAEKGGASNEA